MTLREQIAQIVDESAGGQDAATKIMTLYRSALMSTDWDGPVHKAMSKWTVQDFLYRLEHDSEPTHEAAMGFTEEAITAAIDAAEDGAA